SRHLRGSNRSGHPHNVVRPASPAQPSSVHPTRGSVHPVSTADTEQRIALPMTVPARPITALPMPDAVTIYEVGPRDGLQNEKAVVPVEVKAEMITRLLDAGLPIIEATSFVHPKWVPQLADAAELMGLLVERLGDAARRMPVLVP